MGSWFKNFGLLIVLLLIGPFVLAGAAAEKVMGWIEDRVDG